MYAIRSYYVATGLVQQQTQRLNLSANTDIGTLRDVVTSYNFV